MDKELRTVGIPGIDKAPWGTHYCHFYETPKGLMDLLVPYFKAGLENNEFCLWVTPTRRDEKDARNAMKKVAPQFDRYVQGGQIEFFLSIEYLLEGGEFDIHWVLRDWIKKLDRALAKGYDGMRVAGNVTGNITALGKSRWDDFAKFEQLLDRTIQEFKMLILCAYALDQCKAIDVIDVVRYHQSALVERTGKWEGVESAELKRKSSEGTKLNDAALHLLSAREREVLEFVAQGHTNQVIADRLKLSIKSVETYRARVMEKLNLQNRADLVQFSLEAGILMAVGKM